MSFRDWRRRAAAHFRRKDTELLGYEDLSNYSGFDWSTAQPQKLKNPKYDALFGKLMNNQLDEEARAIIDNMIHDYTNIDYKTPDEKIIPWARLQTQMFKFAAKDWPQEVRTYKLTLESLTLEKPIRVKEKKAFPVVLDIEGFTYDTEELEQTWGVKQARRKGAEESLAGGKDKMLAEGNLGGLSFWEGVRPSSESEERIARFEREIDKTQIFLIPSGAVILRMQLTANDAAPNPYQQNFYLIREPEYLEPFFGVAPQPVVPKGPVVAPPVPV